MTSNATISVTSLTTSNATTGATPGTNGDSWKSTFIYVIFGLGAAILVVAIVLVAMLLVRYRRRRKLQKATKAKLSVINVRPFPTEGGSRFYDRRLTGASIATVTCFGNSTPDSCDIENAGGAEFIWYTGNRSTSGSSPTRTSGDTLTTSGTVSANSDIGEFIGPYEGHFLEYDEDTEVQYATLHRSSPLATLAALYTGNDGIGRPPAVGMSQPLHRSCCDRKVRENIAAISSGTNTSSTDFVGIVNGGFIGDVETGYGRISVADAVADADAKTTTTTTPIAAIESWWSRLSWRARLRAGISGSVSTAASDPTFERGRRRPASELTLHRQHSYLTDVLDSVRFFSGDLQLCSVDGATHRKSNMECRSSPGMPKRATTSRTSPTPTTSALPEVDLVPSIGNAIFYGGGEWCLRRPVSTSSSSSAVAASDDARNYRLPRQRQLSSNSGLSSDGHEVIVAEGGNGLVDWKERRLRPTSRYSSSVLERSDRLPTLTSSDQCQHYTYYTYGKPIA